MVTAVYWVSEAVPLGAAALVPAFLYPLFGVLKSSEVSVCVGESSQVLKKVSVVSKAPIFWFDHSTVALL